MSVSNSNQQFKWFFFFVCISFLLVFWISFGAYLVRPTLFYWRAWEYFQDIVYSKYFTGTPIWRGKEKGHLSREFAFLFQEKWATTVSADEEGFRKVPYEAKEYPILVVGDSHTWGCGLSDHETFPWRLAENLNLPVFNGGRHAFYLERLLEKENLKKAKLIIELVSFHHLDAAAFPDGFRLDHYSGFKQKAGKQPVMLKRIKMFFRLLAKDPRRYFVPYKIFHALAPDKVIASFTKKEMTDRIGINPKGILELTENDIKQLVDKIEKRQQELARLGYAYMIAAVPPRHLICAKDDMPQTWEAYFGIYKELMERNIPVVDLVDPFYQTQNREALYLKTDLHWGGQGTELAAKLIADYVAENFQDILQRADTTVVLDSKH